MWLCVSGAEWHLTKVYAAVRVVIPSALISVHFYFLLQ